MTEPHKQHLYLMAFIDHCYKMWIDTLVDVLLKCVQQQLNKAKRVVGQMLIDRLPEKNQLTASVLAGLDDSQSTIHAVRVVVHDPILSSDDKILKLYQLVPCQEKSEPQIKVDLNAEKLKRQLEAEVAQRDDFDALSSLSIKLQNRVSEIVKYLKFEASKGAEDLYSAIKHYQSTKNITSTAPDAFLDDNEHAAIHRDEKFNVSLYKAILFCKIAAAIKCGQISLVHSYRYLSIDAV